MYVSFGPTVGAIITILLVEALRIIIGTEVVGLDTTIYGLMLILFIIFLPQGVLGAILQRWSQNGTARTMAVSARATASTNLS